MVGDILRRERERQKLSVKDIEQGTSIRALYIEAIENGEYDKLPGSVYTNGKCLIGSPFDKELVKKFLHRRCLCKQNQIQKRCPQNPRLRPCLRR